MTFFLNLQVC